MAIIYGGNSFSSDYDFDKNEYKSYTETATKWTSQAKVVTDGEECNNFFHLKYDIFYRKI